MLTEKKTFPDGDSTEMPSITLRSEPFLQRILFPSQRKFDDHKTITIWLRWYQLCGC